MFDHLTDVVALLEYIDEILEALATDGRYALYVRDLSRLVTWLRSQSRGRVVFTGAGGRGISRGVGEQSQSPRRGNTDPAHDAAGMRKRWRSLFAQLRRLSGRPTYRVVSG